MATLEHFQRQTSDALLDSTAACPDAVGGAQAGQRARRFDVYRNNRAVSLIENLQATYPAVEKLVGGTFFTAAARAFIDVHPPSSPVMAEFGVQFGEFVAKLPGSQSIPYIADVAAIEWARNAAYHAADTPILTLHALAQYPVDALPGLALQRHPAVSVVRSAWPVGSIWSDSVHPSEDTRAIDMQAGEFVVIARPEWDVLVHTLAAPTADFLDAMLQAHSIGSAAERVLTDHADFDPGAHLAHLIGLGLFAKLPTADT